MGSQHVYNRIFDEKTYELVNPDNKNIIKDFMQELKSQKKSEGTIKQYFNDLRIVAIWIYKECENRSILDLRKRDFRNFVLYCDSEWNLSNARINRLMSAVRMLCSFLEDDEEEYEEYDRSPAAKIKGLPKEAVREIEFFSNEVVEQLYNKLMKEERYKEATLLAILYESGCRKNEILQVRRDSIKEDKNATNKVIGKRKKVFNVLYFNKTKESFKKYDATRTDSNPMLFITQTGESAGPLTLYEWVTKWKKDLFELTGEQYEGLNCHTFRHLYIEHMTDGTHWLCKDLNLGRVPIEKVKVLVHHNDVSTTDGYRSNDEERDIQELLNITI